MSDKPELKPCPFCGGDAIQDDSQHGYWIGCTKCECVLEIDGKKEAIKSWNQRADLAKPSEWISAQLPPEKSNAVLARYRGNQPFVAKYVDLTWYDDQGQERDPSHWTELPERTS